jgi:hypothetical protein
MSRNLNADEEEETALFFNELVVMSQPRVSTLVVAVCLRYAILVIGGLADHIQSRN